jgi:CopG antitoxin of type II toxin-antitoxin system
MEKSARSRKKRRDPIPENFDTIEEAARFWDTHSVADYLDQMKEVTDVDLQIVRRHFRIDDKLARKIDRIARRRGVPPETLVKVWLQEKVS